VIQEQVRSLWKRIESMMRRTSSSDAWTANVAGPLSDAGIRTANLAIDGIEQLDVTVRRQLIGRVRRLLHDSPERVRVLISSNGTIADLESDDITSAVVQLEALDDETLADWLFSEGRSRKVTDAVRSRYSGSWLLARMLSDFEALEGDADLPWSLDEAYAAIHERGLSDLGEQSTGSLLALLAANVPMPTPLPILQYALQVEEGQLGISRLRDLLARLSPLIARLHPGTEIEMLCPLHASYIEYLRRTTPSDDLRTAHDAMLAATEQAVGSRDRRAVLPEGYLPNQPNLATNNVEHYAYIARPEHVLGAGRIDLLASAIGELHQYRRTSPRDRLDDIVRWTLAAQEFASLPFGAPELFELRALGVAAMISAGENRSALAASRELLADQLAAGNSQTEASVVNTQCQIVLCMSILGEREEALKLAENALVGATRTLGRYHRTTLQLRSFVATAKTDLSPDDVANVRVYSQLLRDSVRALGEEDDRTLSTKANLGHRLVRVGRSREALALFNELLSTRRKVLGARHEETLITETYVASAMVSSGEVLKGVIYHEDVVSRMKEILGEDDLETLAARVNLSRVLRIAHRTSKALRELDLLIQDQSRILGEDHPHTLGTRLIVAEILVEEGGRGLGLAYLQRLLPDLVRVYGDEHPSTTQAHVFEMQALIALGRRQDASRKARLLLPRLERDLGENDPAVYELRALASAGP